MIDSTMWGLRSARPLSNYLSLLCEQRGSDQHAHCRTDLHLSLLCEQRVDVRALLAHGCRERLVARQPPRLNENRERCKLPLVRCLPPPCAPTFSARPSMMFSCTERVSSRRGSCARSAEVGVGFRREAHTIRPLQAGRFSQPPRPSPDAQSGSSSSSSNARPAPRLTADAQPVPPPFPTHSRRAARLASTCGRQTRRPARRGS